LYWKTAGELRLGWTPVGPIFDPGGGALGEIVKGNVAGVTVTLES